MKEILVACLCVFLLLLATPVIAHKVNIFASAEGKLISGYVYYTGGGNPKQALISVQDRHGNELGEAQTDEKGEFTFSAELREDHLFILELADGHRATFTVKAEELPEDLVSNESAEPQRQDSEGSVEPAEEKTPAAIPASSLQEQMTIQISAAELEDRIEKALSKQIRPLREQLDRYEKNVRLHDILGGIGYIVGLMGLWYFLSSRKQR